MNNLSAASCNNRRGGCGISPIFLILILCSCGGEGGGLFGNSCGCGNNGGLDGILPIILLLCCCGGSF